MSSSGFEPITRFVQRATVPIVVFLGLIAGLAALFFTGAANPTLLNDPGSVVRFGLPTAKFVFNTAMSLTVGALMFAVLILPRTAGGRGRRHKNTGEDLPLDPLWTRAVRIAEVSSVVWTLSAVAVLVFSFVDTVGAQAYLDFSNQLGVFVTQIA